MAFTCDMVVAAKLASRLVERILQHASGEARLYNLNIPAGEDWALRATVSGHRHYDHGVHLRKDPRGGDYLWIGGSNIRHDRALGTDTCAWADGVASLPRLRIDPSTDRPSSDCVDLVEQFSAPAGS